MLVRAGTLEPETELMDIPDVFAFLTKMRKRIYTRVMKKNNVVDRTGVFGDRALKRYSPGIAEPQRLKDTKALNPITPNVKS